MLEYTVAPDEYLTSVEKRRFWELALNYLEESYPKMAKVVELHLVRDLNYRQIGEELGISPSYARECITRWLPKRLKKAIHRGKLGDFTYRRLLELYYGW